VKFLQVDSQTLERILQAARDDDMMVGSEYGRERKLKTRKGRDEKRS
jgi:regulator of extracellular matrix RemA (YlzA/DUF370 family)